MNVIEALTPPTVSLHPVELVREFRNHQGGEYVRKAAALMKTAFEVLEETKDPLYLAFSGILANPQNSAGHLKLASVVMTCLGRVTLNRPQEKVAGPVGFAAKAYNGARTTLGLGGSVAGEAVKILGLVGAGAGSVAGAGLWAGNRALTGEDQKLRELQIQRDTYQQLAKEVRDELNRRKMAPTPQNMAAAVDYLT